MDECPICFSDLTGEPIPQEYLSFYGGKTHYSRMIGEEVRGVYDGVLIWHCPDCGGMWPRFSSGFLYDEAILRIDQRIKEDEYVAAQTQ